MCFSCRTTMLVCLESWRPFSTYFQNLQFVMTAHGSLGNAAFCVTRFERIAIIRFHLYASLLFCVSIIFHIIWDSRPRPCPVSVQCWEKSTRPVLLDKSDSPCLLFTSVVTSITIVILHRSVVHLQQPRRKSPPPVSRASIIYPP